jgi:Ca2+-binding RTX toxin-like protein
MKPRAVLILATMLLGGLLLSGVALAVNKVCPPNNPCRGTNSKDKLTGNASRNVVYANGGKDYAKGNRGDDNLYGGPRNDRLDGGDGADYLNGNDGYDVAYGRDGTDTMDLVEQPSYGPQSVEIRGAEKAVHDRKPGGRTRGKPNAPRRADRLFGGPDTDNIFTDDGKRDVINCGRGRDEAVIDQFDTRVNCEAVTVEVTRPPPSTPPDTTPPVVTIDKHNLDLPEQSVDADGRVTFWFSANEDSAFYCQLTDVTRSLSPEFTLCGSATMNGSKSYPESPQGSPLEPGNYRFEVYAVDQAALASEVVSKNFSVCVEGMCNLRQSIVGFP